MESTPNYSKKKKRAFFILSISFSPFFSKSLAPFIRN